MKIIESKRTRAGRLSTEPHVPLDKNPKEIAKWFESERKILDKKLSTVFQKKKPLSLYEPAHFILRGSGKRLRPLLVLLSVRAVGGDPKRFYNAAISAELLHNFTLVHDDIMDNSDKRRGKPTLHKKYDLSTAILVGDALLAIAYQYLLKDALAVPSAVVTFTRGLVEVCEGQSLDKEFETKPSVTLPEYLLMIKKKTAFMASMCCTIGAQLGGAAEFEVKALAHFGMQLGMAFQIQDDLLDTMGDETAFGKQIGKDLIEGKKTFLFLRALEKADAKTRKHLTAMASQKGIDPKDVPFYQEIYNTLGIPRDAEREIKRYTNSALKSIEVLNCSEEKEMFRWLADALLHRQK